MPTLKTMALKLVGPALVAYAKDEMLAAVAARKAFKASDDASDDEKENDIDKVCMLKLSRGAALLRLSSPDHPRHADICAALVGPVLDGTEYDADNEEAERSGRKIVKRMVEGSVGAFVNLLGVYLHEHSHAAVGRAFGHAPTVHADVKIVETKTPLGVGLGLGVEVNGGTCRHATDAPIPPNQKAAISVAGFMGELCVPALALIVREEDDGQQARMEMTRDKHFWTGLFRAINMHNEDENASGKPKKSDNIFVHTSGSGSESDARDLYESAPTKDLRLVAVLKAGEVLDAEAKNIWDVALDNTINHLRVINDALRLRTLAHLLCERAQGGEFGAAFVSEIAPAKVTLQ